MVVDDGRSVARAAVRGRRVNFQSRPETRRGLALIVEDDALDREPRGLCAPLAVGEKLRGRLNRAGQDEAARGRVEVDEGELQRERAPRISIGECLSQIRVRLLLLRLL